MIRVLSDDSTCFKQAADTINNGGILAYPTDTLYGLGVNARDDDAIRRLNALKKRSGPMSIVAPSLATALLWIDTTKVDSNNVKKLLGGTNTVIVPIVADVVSKLIFAQSDHNNSNLITLGIRIPQHPFTLGFATVYPDPYTTTSVNRTGEPPLNEPDLIAAEFHDSIDLLVDTGPLPESKGSTIYKLIGQSIETIRE
ncbi:MAG: L-threonylcarbamoyladenylate synthase [Candidatus Neomarinimicrobiota bacterium]